MWDGGNVFGLFCFWFFFKMGQVAFFNVEERVPGEMKMCQSRGKRVSAGAMCFRRGMNAVHRQRRRLATRAGQFLTGYEWEGRTQVYLQ